MQIPGESWIDKIVTAAVNNQWLLTLLTLAGIGLVFYFIYLKFHRKYRQQDLKMKKEIEASKAQQTANINSTAVIQTQGAKDIINGVARLEDALHVAKDIAKNLSRPCDDCPNKE